MVARVTAARRRHRGRFPPPCRTLPARRVARGPPVAWVCAEHFLCLGRARDGRTIDCSLWVSSGVDMACLWKLEVTNGSAAARATSREDRRSSARRWDVYLTEALVFGVVLRPPCPRGGAIFRGRARNHPISPPPRAARDAPRRRVGLGESTRGQRIEEASGFIGRVIDFCGLKSSLSASRRVSRRMDGLTARRAM